MAKWLVTGSAGFIGCNFAQQSLLETNVELVVSLDKLTYAGSLASLKAIEKEPRHKFIEGDICDRPLIRKLLKEHEFDAVVHFAAESHVDRSIEGPEVFVQTNVYGTFSLLEETRLYWQELAKEQKTKFRFLHISTDEVYGTLGETGLFSEETPYAPNSPYSASKAASDHFARAYFHTYGLPVMISNCSNNYGPYQFPEKLIPLMILNALEGKSLPVYGEGKNVRDWLYVEDHCRALRTILEKGLPGEKYNIGGHNEKTNLDIVHTICGILDKEQPRQDGRSYAEQIVFVADRPGHDLRYAIDAGKIQRELAWVPQETFETGIRRTIEWYLSHQAWCDEVTKGIYERTRLGQVGG